MRKLADRMLVFFRYNRCFLVGFAMAFDLTGQIGRQLLDGHREHFAALAENCNPQRDIENLCQDFQNIGGDFRAVMQK